MMPPSLSAKLLAALWALIASLLAPLSYTQMIWAVIAGLLVFGDAPDGVTLFGIGVIALSGVVVAFSGRSKKNS